MIRKAMLTFAVLALTASSAWAINPDLGPNSIGVFFEPTADTNCNTTATPYTTLTAYLIACNTSQPSGMSAWEATLCVNPTTFSAGLTLDLGAGALEVLVPPVFEVATSPHRTGQTIVLVTISTFYLGGPIVFGIGPCAPTSFTENPGPGYADGDDPSILVRLFVPTSMQWTLPIWRGSNTDDRLPDNGPPGSFVVAAVNSEPCPTAVESSSWGSVKTLYR